MIVIDFQGFSEFGSVVLRVWQNLERAGEKNLVGRCEVAKFKNSSDEERALGRC
jgi:hypothetical protein